MGKVWAFISKWAFAIVLCLVAVTLLFALGCCVYTAIVNPIVGIVGVIGAFLAVATVVGLIMQEIKEG